MNEQPLCELIPLWRTLREQEVTALITPALDYVGAVELGGLDARFAGDGALSGVGEALRGVIASLEDGTTLHLLYRVSGDFSADVADYLAESGSSENPLLAEYVRGRAEHLGQARLRVPRLYLFFSPPGGASLRGPLGVPPSYADLRALSAEEHSKRLKAVGLLRNHLRDRLREAGVSCRELAVSEVQGLYYHLLNPSRAARGFAPPQVTLKDNLWTKQRLRPEDYSVLELTEAEQLCFESVQELPDHLRQGEVLRRVCTLKLLPEGGTEPFGVRPLLELCETDPERGTVPFGYTLSVSVRVLAQGPSRFKLDAQHGLVAALREALPFLQRKSAERDAADRAKAAAIEGLFEELAEQSTKLCELSVAALVEAEGPEQLEDRTRALEGAFRRVGNAELCREEYAQLAGLLSVLPGSGRYPLRSKGATSRNCADFLPVYAPWRGTKKAVSLLTTPDGAPLRLDLFDPELATAHHALVAADTGSGKSVAVASLVLDRLASGDEAILVDNGNSWKRLTELLGGTHVPVNLRTSLAPFAPYSGMLNGQGELDPEEVESVVGFLEVCVSDKDLHGFDKPQLDFVSRAVTWLYGERLKRRPGEAPVMSHFRDALLRYPNPTATQRAIAEDLAARLAIYCDGLYGDFLNRPSKLRFDAKLLTFELGEVFDSASTRTVAVATLMQAINRRAAARRARAVVAVDEAHRLLDNDAVATRYLGDCYRTMRKHGVAMWAISQNWSDFASSAAAPAIVGNSTIKVFLTHGPGKHAPLIDYFHLSRRAAEAFMRLQVKKGEHSDLLLLYGPVVTTARLALHPFAYWLLTTDPLDRALLDSARSKNPRLAELELLRRMAQLYPKGASGPVRAAA